MDEEDDEIFVIEDDRRSRMHDTKGTSVYTSSSDISSASDDTSLVAEKSIRWKPRYTSHKDLILSTLVTGERSVMGGTRSALVHQLVTGYEKSLQLPPRLCSPTKPTKFLYMVGKELSRESENKYILEMKQNVMFILLDWTRLYIEHIAVDEDLQTAIKQFAVEHLTILLSKTLLKNLNETLTEFYMQQSPHKSVTTLTRTSLISFTALEIANELTMASSDLFANVNPIDFLVKNRTFTSLEATVTRFNLVSNWVAQEVLEEAKIGHRTKIIKLFVEVALICRTQNNFAEVFALVLGLQRAPVYRLKHTWKRLQTTDPKLFSKWMKLIDIVDTDGNSKNYRQMIAGLGTGNIPVISYLGIVSKDVLFTRDSFGDLLTLDKPNDKAKKSEKRPKKYINFAKLDRLASVILEVKIHQTHKHNLPRCPELSEYLNSRPEPDVSLFFKRSLALEPRGSM